jgi:hypothetical protein
MEKKLAVAKTNIHYKQLGGERPSFANIASEHKVDWWCVCVCVCVSDLQ